MKHIEPDGRFYMLGYFATGLVDVVIGSAKQVPNLPTIQMLFATALEILVGLVPARAIFKREDSSCQSGLSVP